MNFRQFALINVKRNTRSYAAYFLSSVFSITIFFIYAAFIFHPDVEANLFKPETYSDSPEQNGLRTLMIIAEVIIFSFSFLFVLYSMSAFLHSRKKDFGVLGLLGITKGQLNKLIFIENNVIGIAAIIAGISLGALFFRLFLMAFSAILSLPDILPFFIAPKALLLTIGAFLLLFEVICFFTLFTVRVNNIPELLYSMKKPKKYPKYSIVLSFIGLLTIGIGYYLAYTATVFSMVMLAIPITLLVSFGTYFLFTQCSIMVIQWLQKKRSLYLQSTNLLTISDLAFKLKDNARVLFIVTILSAVAFTSSGVLFGMVMNTIEEVEVRNPQSISLSTTTNVQGFNKTKKQLTQALKQEHIPFEAHELKLIYAQYKFDQNQIKSPVGTVLYSDKTRANIHLLSQQDYNIWAKLTNQRTFQLKKNQALFVPSTPDQGIIWYEKDDITIDVDKRPYTFSLQYLKKPIVSPMALTYEVLVINDTLYKELLNDHSSVNDINYLGIHIPNWQNYTEKILTISDQLKLDKGLYFDSRAEMMNFYKGIFYLPFFIGLLVSCLFFLAAASILYFRLYQDIDNDLVHYRALYRMGLTEGEMKSIISKQILLLFLIPFLVATIHASFAFKALHNMIAGSVLGSSMLIFGIFFLLQLIYYYVVKTLYFKKLKQVM